MRGALVSSRPWTGEAAPYPAHQPRALKPGVVESSGGRGAGFFRLIIDKGAVALGNQKNTFNVMSGIAGKVVLEIDHVRARWEITNP